jgi:SAM-dependent methyltransferase
MDARLNAPVWRHDAYTLRGLQAAVRAQLEQLKGGFAGKKLGNVVDVGAGDAPYKPLFEGHCERYISCDLVAGPGIDLTFDEQGRLPLEEGSADCVVSFQVLEHVWDIDAYLSECRRLLSPEGRLIISTHGTWLYHPHPTDFRRWTRAGLCRELAERGFDLEHVQAVVGPLAWTTQFRALAYHHVLSKFGPLGRFLAGAICALMYGRMVLEDRLTPAQLIDDNAAIYCITARVAR